jgi:hypothetical protein
METIHIDRYDANASTETPTTSEKAWYEKVLPEGLSKAIPENVPAELKSMAGRIQEQVKAHPKLAVAAALGVGALLFGGLKRGGLARQALGMVTAPTRPMAIPV